jgi:type I restriction enzyme S subunit
MSTGVLQGEDVLINKDGAQTWKVAAYADEFPAAVINEHLFLLRADPEVATPRFLYWTLLSSAAQRQISQLVKGSAQPGLGQGFVDRVMIGLPHPSHQAVVAEILDTLDQAIRRTEELIAKSELMKQGLLQDLLTRGIDKNGDLRDPRRHPDQFREASIGSVPENWSVSTVEAQFDITSGITLGPHRRPRAHPWPYLRVANVFRERLSLGDIALLEATTGELEGRTLEEGDLLVVEGHANPEEIGRCAMATRDVVGLAFQNHLFRLRSRELNSDFALYWMNSTHVRKYWRQVSSSSSGLSTINQAKLRKLLVFVPPREEQDLIAERVRAVACRLAEEERTRCKLLLLRQGLMEELLTGRVRVSKLLESDVA